MERLIELLDAALERGQEQAAKKELEMKKEIEIYQAAALKQIREVNSRNYMYVGQIESRDGKAQELATLEESVKTVAHGTQTQVEIRDGKAQELATLEESVKTVAHGTETQIESHMETALKELLQIQLKVKAAGEIPEARAANTNNSIIQINSHVTKALEEMSKIKKKLEARKKLKARKEALTFKTITIALTEASPPESSVRLVIAYPRAVNQCPRGDHVIPLKKMLDSKDLFGVI
ncbi:hypothetical protein GGI35DRAFT_465400 [Trichoderma velutinum]